ncbi:MAG: hypothetical protein EXS08_08680 [Planctomycetes bacterium]|nr:hypothetical protein [Planctomycetota bacterium]
MKPWPRSKGPRRNAASFRRGLRLRPAALARVCARGLSLALPLSALACASAPAPTAPAVAAETPNLLSGQLRSRYRGRFTGDESDHDLYETVDLTVTDPDKRYSGAVLARGMLDLDGTDGKFFDISDTYDSSFVPQLFHAYLDVSTSAFELLRLGRQPLYETPVTVVLDGVRADLAPIGDEHLEFGAYAGVGEHMYESSSEGDSVLGGFGATRAWEGAELRADWMHLADARMGIDHEDDLFGLALSQDLLHEESATRMEARFTSLEGNGRDLRLTGSHVDAPGRWSLQGSLYQLLQTQKTLAAPLDPFSDTLFELFPYAQLGLSASKDWTHLTLLSGADVRRVTHAEDEGEFNRDFQRYYLTSTLPDVLPVSLSLTGELWRATDTNYETWGAALQKELDSGWNVTLGSYYALYEYDLFSAQERDHVRSTYLDLRWKVEAARRWSLRYQFERNDVDDFQQVELDYSWSF